MRKTNQTMVSIEEIKSHFTIENGTRELGLNEGNENYIKQLIKSMYKVFGINDQNLGQSRNERIWDSLEMRELGTVQK